MPKHSPAFIKVHPPVETDHITAGGANLFQQTGCAGAEVDHRDTRCDRIDYGFSVRQHELLVIGRRQATDPAIKKLHGLGAGGDLAIQIFRHDFGEPFHQPFPCLRRAIEKFLGVHVIA